jgi:hypothetical protein
VADVLVVARQRHDEALPQPCPGARLLLAVFDEREPHEPGPAAFGGACKGRRGLVLRRQALDGGDLLRPGGDAHARAVDARQEPRGLQRAAHRLVELERQRQLSEDVRPPTLALCALERGREVVHHALEPLVRPLDRLHEQSLVAPSRPPRKQEPDHEQNNRGQCRRAGSEKDGHGS